MNGAGDLCEFIRGIAAGIDDLLEIVIAPIGQATITQLLANLLGGVSIG